MTASSLEDKKDFHEASQDMHRYRDKKPNSAHYPTTETFKGKSFLRIPNAIRL